ncbi:nucleotidyl transferase AbiEii/AbiGii toxin family protein [Chitinimonas arctica]|uniref:Nucleotidyl transferase AbiEii/AbiGii toxin family protein n=1 Tax=Chitinimonas arctica TaxID=2594795 RepID=A0A516SJN1_9NEIS|nr:nucleotidyl transferase AbiEii/AbiGii toxin family protein [Chitinimonas arctica]QDQ28372.1 nucleotidyl transferase AbiEii/AbiGii toxin family protein [Chitinimonas arctica]
MYKRTHHQRIERVLASMNAEFLANARCYFGGGTAIALQLDEYRESVDIDFLCADQGGYRSIREAIFGDPHLKTLFRQPINLLREPRTDQDGVRTVLEMDGAPIKFEIVRESRILLDGVAVPGIPVLCLTRSDSFAEKLLANADRYYDRSVMNRDIIDLLVMELHWGSIPDSAWHKAEAAYGKTIRSAYDAAKQRIGDTKYLLSCASTMGMSQDVVDAVVDALLIPDSDPDDEPRGLRP